MDRVIVYPAQIVSDTDTLVAQRNIENSIGTAINLVMGWPGSFATGFGLSCSGSDLVVNIGSGQINVVDQVDGSSYGSLPASSSQIMRQFVSSGASFTLTSSSSDQSFYISVHTELVDGGAALLRYMDATDPSRTLAGVNNDGAAQPTLRSAAATLSLSTSQSTDSSSYAIWRIDLPANATAVTQAMCTMVGGSFFYPTLPQLAPKESPAFTGSPTAPTPSSDDSSTRLATTAFVTNWSTANLLATNMYYGPSATAGGSNVFQFSLLPRTRFAIIELSAGGGGGGGAPSSSSSLAGVGGGGGAGGYCRFIVQANSLSWPVTVTLGCGGRGGQSASSAMTGNNGGNSSFGALITCTGGYGGQAVQGGGVAIIGGSGTGGAVQITPVSAISILMQTSGESGSSGHVTGVSENYFFGYGGKGGGSGIFAGGGEIPSQQPGNMGNTGSGGAGSCVAPGGSYQNGGDGGSGWMLVSQYG